MPRSRFRSRNDDHFSAKRVFTDRDEPQKAFHQAVKNQSSDAPYVVTYYGVGGIGKTALRKELQKYVKDIRQYNAWSCLIDFEVEDLREPIQAVGYLRRNVPYPCDIFDFAFSRYWGLLGRPLAELSDRLGEEEGLVGEILRQGTDVGANLLTGGVFVPGVALIKKLTDEIRKRWKRRTHGMRDLIEDIDNIGIQDLRIRLPYYLGLDLASMAAARPVILFFDHFEKLWLDKDDNLKPRDSYTDQWVRDLIAPADGVTVGIFSRRKLGWADLIQEEWEGEIEEHLLGALATEDSDAFLRSVPISDPKVRRHILSIAEGLPLLLDLCVSIYESQKSAGKPVKLSSFGSSREEVIERYFRHLSQPERETSKVLAIPREFNRSLFRRLVRNFGTQYPETAYGDICDLHFFQLNEEDGVARMHDVLRSHLLGELSKKQIAEGESVIIDYHRNLTTSSVINIMRSFKEVVRLADVEDSDTIDWVFESALDLLHEGYWQEVADALEVRSEDEEFFDTPSIQAIYAITQRRTGSAEGARQIFESIDEAELPEERKSLVRFEYADTVRLTGSFTESLSLYKSLIEDEAAPETEQARALRQYADGLMLKGRFREGLRLLQNQLEKDTTERQKAYTLRQVGHIYRFNFLFQEARESYKTAMSYADRAGDVGMVGKLYTNLCETRIYELRGRDQEMEQKAIETNEDLGNVIEVGKAFGAVGMCSLLVDNDLGRSEEIFVRAEERFSTSGYVGGKLVLRSYRVVHHLAGSDAEAAEREWQMLVDETSESEAYEYLALPYSYWTGKSLDLTSSSEANWLKEASPQSAWEKVENRINDLSE